MASAVIRCPSLERSNTRTLSAPPLQRFALCAPTLGDGGGGRSTGSPSPSWRRGHAQRARWSGARPPPVLRPDGGHRCAPTLGGGGRSTGSPSPTRRRRGHAQRARWSGARRSPCSRPDGGHCCAPTLERFALQRFNARTLQRFYHGRKRLKKLSWEITVPSERRTVRPMLTFVYPPPGYVTCGGD